MRILKRKVCIHFNVIQIALPNSERVFEMRRFVCRRLLSFVPSLRTASVSQWTLPSMPQPNRLLVNCRQLRMEDTYSRSGMHYSSWNSFSTEVPDKDEAEAAKQEQEAPSDGVEATASEVSNEEVTIESLNQSLKDYEALIKKQEEALIQLASQMDDEKRNRLQALADAENLRTRFARESIQTKKFAVQEFIKNLLGCIDNLDRAVESVPEMVQNSNQAEEATTEQLLKAMEALLTGVKLTQNEFKNVKLISCNCEFGGCLTGLDCSRSGAL